MKELNKKIFSELVFTPATLLPVSLGLTMFALSYVFGGILAFVGFLSMILGLGALIVNATANLKTISQRALKQWRLSEKRKQDRKLNHLEFKLRRTKEKEDEDHLRNLRQLYNSFCDETADKTNDHVPTDMIMQIDKIFSACVHNLESSYHLYITSKKMRGDLKKDMQRQRMEMINKVGESVGMISNAIGQVRKLKYKSEANDLQEVRDDLSRSLRICLKEDEMMHGMSDDESLRKYAEEYDIE